MLPTRKLNSQSWLPDFFNDFFENGALDKSGSSVPAINVIEEERGYKLELAAPGTTKEDFKVHINRDGNLEIEMEKKKEEEEKKEGHYLRKEFSYSKFHQTLILPENADKEKIEARVSDGVLKVMIPKAHETEKDEKKRAIEVKERLRPEYIDFHCFSDSELHQTADPKRLAVIFFAKNHQKSSKKFGGSDFLRTFASAFKENA